MYERDDGFDVDKEHLQQCSVCDSGEINWMNKSQNMLVWLKKICFGAASLHNFAMASKRRNNDVHLQKKKV
jgi:hypothetical protein